MIYCLISLQVSCKLSMASELHFQASQLEHEAMAYQSIALAGKFTWVLSDPSWIT